MSVIIWEHVFQTATDTGTCVSLAFIEQKLQEKGSRSVRELISEVKIAMASTSSLKRHSTLVKTSVTSSHCWLGNMMKCFRDP